MRMSLVAGVLLAAVSMIVVILGSALDLDLQSVALLGAAMGAVVGLVPDRAPMVRLGGFAAGFVIAWAGYVLRAQVMPDTDAGRAVVVGIVVLLCVLVVAATMDRVPLWAVLLGAGAFAGAYEFAYNEAPPEVLSTSVSTATTMALNVAMGFLAAVLVAPISGKGSVGGDRRTPVQGQPGDHLDETVGTDATSTDVLTQGVSR